MGIVCEDLQLGVRQRLVALDGTGGRYPSALCGRTRL